MNTKTFPLVALLLGLSSAGCAPDRMSLEPYGICSMPSTCSFGGKCDTYFGGTIEYHSTAGTEWLFAVIEVRNQIANNRDLSVGRVNNNDAHITGVRLEIDGPASGNLTVDMFPDPIPANGSGVVFTPILPPGTTGSAGPPPVPASGPPSGSYIVNVVYIGYYDNGREFETPGFPVAVTVDDAGTGFGCTGTKVITCGTPQQSLSTCGTP